MNKRTVIQVRKHTHDYNNKKRYEHAITPTSGALSTRKVWTWNDVGRMQNKQAKYPRYDANKMKFTMVTRSSL